MRDPGVPRTHGRESAFGSAWDTRSGVRAGGRNRLAVAVGVFLLAAAILAAVTGRVFAFDPPDLTDSAPAADHSALPDASPGPGPFDTSGIFLDLPDPPSNTGAGVRDAATRPAGPRIRHQAGERRRSTAGGRRSGVDATRGGQESRPRAASDVFEDVPGLPEAPPIKSVRPGSGRVEDLLADPDCRFSVFALADLRAGIVDDYLVSALQAVCREHSIYVNVFKTGHTFGPGMVEGPTIPEGYGNAGGYPNTHYFGRAADIWEVDGKPVEGNGADPGVVSVGEILAGLPARYSPDVVIGPADWNEALSYGPEQGWVLAPDQVYLHEDHIHMGYWQGDGTPPPQVFLSPEQLRGGPVAPEAAGTAAGSGSETRRSRNQPDSQIKETRRPATSPAGESPRTAPSTKKRPSEEPVRPKVEERRTRPAVETPAERPRAPEPSDRSEPVRRPAPDPGRDEPRPEPEPERTAAAEPEDPAPDKGRTTVVERTPEDADTGAEESVTGPVETLEDGSGGGEVTQSPDAAGTTGELGAGWGG